MRELNRAVQILEESYRNIIKSLINLTKQEKRTATMETSTEKNEKITNMLTTISDLKSNMIKTDQTVVNSGVIREERKQISNGEKKKKDTSINTQYRLPQEDTNRSYLSTDMVVVTKDSPFIMERFLNPITRDETFSQLFNEVDTLNKSLSKLKEFFDNYGDFMIQEYENSNYRISRNTFDMVQQKVSLKDLAYKRCRIIDCCYYVLTFITSLLFLLLLLLLF